MYLATRFLSASNAVTTRAFVPRSVTPTTNHRPPTKIAGIKIHDTRMMRLMEVLLHGGSQLNGWRSADICQAILTTFGLSAKTYTLTQLNSALTCAN